MPGKVKPVPPSQQLSVAEAQMIAAARQGIALETRANAFTLLGFAFAAGAIGGAVLRGKLGITLGLAIIGIGAYRIMNPTVANTKGA